LWGVLGFEELPFADKVRLFYKGYRAIELKCAESFLPDPALKRLQENFPHWSSFIP
jgi:hypothetical protein